MVPAPVWQSLIAKLRQSADMRSFGNMPPKLLSLTYHKGDTGRQLSCS
jgi:hypothetical protein